MGGGISLMCENTVNFSAITGMKELSSVIPGLTVSGVVRLGKLPGIGSPPRSCGAQYDRNECPQGATHMVECLA